MKGIKIRTMGAALPSKRVTNFDFEKTLETSDEWIKSRTGIMERRFCDRDADENAAALAVRAAKEAVDVAKEKGISSEEIGLVIVATCSSEQEMPSTASFVQEMLHLKSGIPAFDINVACSGFIYALDIADSMMKKSGIQNALIIGAEELSRIVDFEDRSTCVLFGDGAAAAVISLEENSSYIADLGAEGNSEVLSSAGSIHMDGRSVFRFAVSKLEEEVHLLSHKTGIAPEDLDYIVCHQANKRIIEHVRKKLELPEEMFPMNLHRFGNTSAASIPLMLYELWKDQKLTEGTRVFTIGFGAGLSWGGAYLEF